MRFVVLALACLGGSVADACPVGAHCARIDAPREEITAPQRTTRPIDLRIELRDTKPAWRLDVAPPQRTDDEMPWLWQLLRREVYAQMPRYRDDSLTFVLSPVVIAGSFDTVPGVGLAGDF